MEFFVSDVRLKQWHPGICSRVPSIQIYIEPKSDLCVRRRSLTPPNSGRNEQGLKTSAQYKEARWAGTTSGARRLSHNDAHSVGATFIVVIMGKRRRDRESMEWQERDSRYYCCGVFSLEPVRSQAAPGRPMSVRLNNPHESGCIFPTW